MRRRGLLVAGALGLVGCQASAAQVQRSAPVMLSWSVVEGCPDRAAALARIARALGRAPTTDPARAFGARVEIARDINAQLRMRVETMTATSGGERFVQGNDCEALTDAAAVMVALALDPGAGRRPVPRPRSTTPSRAPAGLDPVRTPFVRGVVRPFIAGDVGTVAASPNVGVGLALGILLGRARIEAVGSHWGAQTIPSAMFGATAEMQMMAAGAVRGCFAFEWSVLAAGPCVGVTAGWLRAQGVGANVLVAKTSSAAWGAATLGGAVDFRLNRTWSLRLDLEGGVAWSRPTFEIQNCCTFQPPWAFARASVGPELRFP